MNQYFFREQNGSGLYLVEDARRGPRYTCDIIVVHGLSGGPTSTWRHPDTNIIWFRDLLPDHIRDEGLRTNARIWTFGYNANAAFSTAQAGVYDHANALLNRVRTARAGHEHHKVIWICHSLGGIVVKSALIEAMINSTYRPILDSTVGIIFLGTPHQGSRAATMASIAAKIAKKTMFMNPATSLLKTLERDSEPLFERVGQFSNICGSIRVCSFFETLPTGHTMIVERASALINLPGEFRMPLDADHVGICRYRNNNDQNFLAVLDCIKELMKLTVQERIPSGTPQGPRAAASFRPPPPPPSNQRTGSWPPQQPQDRNPYPTWDPTNQFYHQNPQVMPGSRSEEYVNTQPFRGVPPRPNQYPPPVLGPYQEHMREVARERSYTQNPPTSSYSSDPFHRQPPGSQDFPGPAPPTRPPKVVPSQFSSERDTRSTAPPAQIHPSDFGYSPRIHGDVNPVIPLSSGRSEFERPASPTNSQCSESIASTNTTSTARSISSSVSSRTASSLTTTSTPILTPAATPALTPAATPVPAPAPAPAPTPTPRNSREGGWRCDVCMNEFPQSDSRVRCLQCYDYDLCIACYEAEQISNNHTLEHKTCYIVTAFTLLPSDLVPADASANPEFSPPRKLPNWTVDSSTDIRSLHIYNNPSHARFLVTNVSPRVYLINLEMNFFISKEVSPAVFDELKKKGLGKLRVAVGTPIDNRVFFRAQRKEDETLPGELFESGTYEDYLLKIPEEATASGQGWVQEVDLPGVVHAQRVMGILLQWSDVQEFQNLEDPVLTIAITGLRLKEPLEYDEVPKAMPKPKPAPPPPIQQEAKGDSDSGEQITLAMIYAAVAQHLRQQEDENEQITLSDIYRALAIQQQQAQQTADLYAVATLLRFQAYLEALEKKNKEEEEQEKLNEALRRLRLQAYLQAVEEQRKEEEEEERQQAVLQQLVFQQAAQQVLFTFMRQ